MKTSETVELMDRLPVAVIGAGPVGLAAAAHLVERGLPVAVFEQGEEVGAALSGWSHVRVFSPWGYNIDTAARSLLEETDWIAPDPKALPTGGDLVRDYLAPLARHPKLAPHVRLGARVTGLTRLGFDKMTTPGRDKAPFVVRWRDADGREARTLARAVIDASGTWFQPNPAGIDGLPVEGEEACGDRIAYGIPDVAGRDRDLYAGRRVLVIGSGHSAINVMLDLVDLRGAAPATRIAWALRRDRIDKLLGGGLNDKLPGRGALGLAAMKAIEGREVELLAPFAARRFSRSGDGLDIEADVNGAPRTLGVDRVIVATGLRPDLSLFQELRVGLDPAVEAPPALAPLIDPNLHSCGTVPPHGAAELRHPEPGFYIVGGKAYGRAPTFLMATGYEQVRSVVAELAGDHEAARQVRLVLPETGVCSGVPDEPEKAAVCCGGPAKSDESACCRADEAAKAEGASGCGCGSERRAEKEQVA